MNVKSQNWCAGFYTCVPKHTHKGSKALEQDKAISSLFVRDTPEGRAICACQTPIEANWVADRLNKAAYLENLCLRYADGSISESEFKEFLVEQNDIEGRIADKQVLFTNVHLSALKWAVGKAFVLLKQQKGLTPKPPDLEASTKELARAREALTVLPKPHKKTW